MSNSHSTSAGTFRQTFSQLRNRDHSTPAPDHASRNGPLDPILMGDSVVVRRLRSQVQRIAPYFRIALLRGETGSGKQRVARALHALSPGAEGPFIVAKAVAIAQSIADDRAEQASAALSLLESAQSGTLYLDCLGELPFTLQAPLLRFLRLCEEQRATSPTAIRNGLHRASRQPQGRPLPAHLLPIRILAATDRDLRILASIGQFHQDLYARLSTVEILVPPLRQRIEDIPILAAWLLRTIANETGQAPKLLANNTLIQLQERLWPNNLRELERALAQAAALAEGALIEPRHLLALVEPPPSTHPSALRFERLHDVIHQHVLDVLTRCGGNKLRAAEMLGISRSTLYRMLNTVSVSTRSLAG